MTIAIARRILDRQINPTNRLALSEFLLSLSLTLDDITRVSFASFYGNDIAWSQAAAVQNTWYQVLDANITDGEAYNAIFSSGASAGQITVAYQGIYKIDWAAAIKANAIGVNLQTGIGITPSGGSIGVQAPGTMPIQVPTANAPFPIAGNCFLALNKNDAVSLAIRTIDAGTPDIAVDFVNLSVYQVRG